MSRLIGIRVAGVLRGGLIAGTLFGLIVASLGRPRGSRAGLRHDGMSARHWLLDRPLVGQYGRRLRLCKN